MNYQDMLSNLFVQLSEAEKDFEMAGIHLGLDPDNWEEQGKYEEAEKAIERLREEIDDLMEL